MVIYACLNAQSDRDNIRCSPNSSYDDKLRPSSKNESDAMEASRFRESRESESLPVGQVIQSQLPQKLLSVFWMALSAALRPFR